MQEIDGEDIQAARKGDEDAFGRLIERFEGSLARQMWRFTHDKRVLDDLVHDTFVEAFFSLPGFQGTAPFQHWLRRIATRVGYAYWKRKEQEKASVPLEDVWDRAAPAPSADGEGANLFDLLEKLPPADRLVLTLQYYEECSSREIAERTGWREDAVRQRASRARTRLKAIAEAAGLGLGKGKGKGKGEDE